MSVCLPAIGNSGRDESIFTRFRTNIRKFKHLIKNDDHDNNNNNNNKTLYKKTYTHFSSHLQLSQRTFPTETAAISITHFMHKSLLLFHPTSYAPTDIRATSLLQLSDKIKALYSTNGNDCTALPWPITLKTEAVISCETTIPSKWTLPLCTATLIQQVCNCSDKMQLLHSLCW